MKLSVKDGRVCTPAGGSYRLLVLPETRMDDAGIGEEGRRVGRGGRDRVGTEAEEIAEPGQLSGLRRRSAEIADEVWGTTAGEHAVGRGKVITGRTVEEILAAEKVQPDFDGCRQCAEARVSSIAPSMGRTSTSSPIRRGVPRRRRLVSFRIAGRQPELWDAETGKIEPAPMWRVKDGHTIVTLNLEQAGSVFVVFRQPAEAPTAFQSSRSTHPADIVSRKMPKLEIRKAVYGDFEQAGRREGRCDCEIGRTGERRRVGGHGRQRPGRRSRRTTSSSNCESIMFSTAWRSRSRSRRTRRCDCPPRRREPPPAPRLSVENGKTWLTVAEPGATVAGDGIDGRLIGQSVGRRLSQARRATGLMGRGLPRRPRRRRRRRSRN